ncbi:winged helix-turn-helix domain-containing protein [Aliikangiella coralliicola]|uniref:OmpR/PhoB-type domain-containing protein n=1 Tax=Aliikangiella coralliicola TaxID=2592383 RepID=A0A545UG72_9GAMM|nr:winged helix-turn-helix domain-containing protein [Aliikangiella coralliicola]TQV88470.1 hypothetical protein FLL46_08070 [Aliikangiella coralliicola]
MKQTQSDNSTNTKLDFITGDWVVRVTELQLEHRQSGQVTSLEPRLASLLLSLSTRNGGLVTKDKLIEEVWQGGVVSDDTIAQAVSRLRKVLGDDPKQPRYVETVWKKGYRWLAEINGELAANVSTHSSQRDNRLPIVLLLLVIVSVGAIIFPEKRDENQDTENIPLTARPLTSDPGMEYKGNLSPDGRNVVYVARSSAKDHPKLMIQDIQGQTLQTLTEEHLDQSPLFSADGKRVAFMRYSAGRQCEIQVKGLISGQVTSAGSCNGSAFPDLTWSSDGESFAFSAQPEQGKPHAIILVKNGQRTQLTSPPSGAWGDFNPTFSPAGNQLVFTRAYTEMQHDLFVIPTHSDVANQSIKLEKQLTRQRSGIMGASWTPNGEQLVLATRRGVNYQLKLITLATGKLESVALALNEVIEPQIAANGDMVATVRKFDTDITRISLAANTSKPENAGAKEILFNSNHWDLSPMVSPDGKQFVFTSDRTGDFQLWLGDINSGATRPLTTFTNQYVVAPRFSRDSQRLVFEVHENQFSQIYTYSLHDGLLLKLTDHESLNSAPSISSDGRFIYFASDRSGEWQIWRKPMDGGSAVKITADGGYFGQESVDGKQLYFSRRNQSGLWELDLNSATPAEKSATLFNRNLHADDWAAFTVVEQGIVYFNRSATRFGEVQLANFTTKEIETLYQATTNIPRFDPVLAVDEKLSNLYLVGTSPPESDLVLVKSAFAD